VALDLVELAEQDWDSQAARGLAELVARGLD
jgi:hypothetical protein